MYKRTYGWRHKDAPLMDPVRLLTSDYGLKRVAIGALTWVAYEAMMRLLQEEAQRANCNDHEY